MVEKEILITLTKATREHNSIYLIHGSLRMLTHLPLYPQLRVGTIS